MSGGMPLSGLTRSPLSPIRLDSCITDPQTELLVAFREENLRVFVDLLSEEEVDVNKEYAEENFKSILQLAVEGDNGDFVTELLRHPATNPNLPNKVMKKVPLHTAVEKGKFGLVKLLLDSGADVNAKMENGNTALHIAALRSSCNWVTGGGNEKYEMLQNMLKIMQLLLNMDNVGFDVENNIECTPLFYAAEKGSEGVVRALLAKGASILSEVDGETVEQWIVKRMPNVLKEVDTSKNRHSSPAAESVLFKSLYNELHNPGGFAVKFKQLTEQGGKINLDSDDGGYTMLQYCCDMGYHEIVDLLIMSGADPNHVGANNKLPPIVWAAHHGYYKVIRVFKRRMLDNQLKVDFSATDNNVRRENVLHKVLKAESKAFSHRDLRNYDECLKLLLDDNSTAFKYNMAAAINAQDNMGNTPLHLAAQVGKHEAVRKLLRCEANLGLKNYRGETPIVHIAPDIMEEYLDDCVSGDGLTTDPKFKITFSYHFLGPPRMKTSSGSVVSEPLIPDAKVDGSGTKLPETEPLWYMSQIKEHRYLLSHPTITSFLWMKWRKMRPYFYLNLTFYLLFVALLTSYILLLNRDLDQEQLSDGEKLTVDQDFIGEPSNQTFVIKWITFAFLVVFSLRELLQLSVSYRRYIFNFENIMEMVLIVLTFYLMFGVGDNKFVIRHISGVVILLSWAEGVFLIGGHPRLATYTNMFTRVSFNFAKFLTWFISFIIAFGLCFFIIFHNPKMGDGEAKNEYFLTPSLALMKTIVMSLTGEMEFADIEFSSQFSRLIFIVYVFFIMLVLVNLLNGLAVSDISEIQKQSEIMSHISRVELMCHFESVLLGDPFKFLTNFPESKFARKLPDCNLFSPLYRLSCVQSVLSLFGSRNFLLFSSRLKGKQAVFTPNSSKKETSGPKGARNDLVLSETILETAKALVVKKQTVNVEEETKRRLEKMEKSLLLLADQQNHIISIINKISK